MTATTGRVGLSEGLAEVPGAAGAARDRWLLMRLLAAGQSLPKLADRLIAERGSLGSVLALSEERLRQLGADANGIAILSLVREAIGAVVDPRPAERRRIDNGGQIARALFPEMAWLDFEQVRAAFLDAGQRLMTIEVLGSGTLHGATVYPREIARRTLELSAAAVILVHNHPSGDPRPSAEDVATSRRVAAALAAIDAMLLDHLVIAREGYASAMPTGESVAGTCVRHINGSHINRRRLNGR
ncbi:MAG: JAB domain-containing protein [Sphingomonadaceae bacterium]